MFQDVSSSSSEEAQPFNAIKAAAEARRKIVPANPEDPVYKAITASLNNPVPQKTEPPAPKRESRYIGKLVEMAAQRKEEGARVSERRLVAKQREEDQIYAGKERFVTSAYRKKLEDDKVRDQQEKLQQSLQEERRRMGLGGFYGNLFSGQNVAMGGNVERAGKDLVTSPETHKEPASTSAPPKPSPTEAASTNPSASNTRKRRRTRFGDAEVHSKTADAKIEHPRNVQAHTAPKTKPVPKIRGLRRNDEKSIEEYRRRYFERRAKRLGQTLAGDVG